MLAGSSSAKRQGVMCVMGYLPEHEAHWTRALKGSRGSDLREVVGHGACVSQCQQLLFTHLSVGSRVRGGKDILHTPLQYPMVSQSLASEQISKYPSAGLSRTWRAVSRLRLGHSVLQSHAKLVHWPGTLLIPGY
jgi:hypothetical protein